MESYAQHLVSEKEAEIVELKDKLEKWIGLEYNATMKICNKEEDVKELVQALANMFIGHDFKIAFKSKEEQSKYSECLQAAKSLIQKHKTTSEETIK